MLADEMTNQTELKRLKAAADVAYAAWAAADAEAWVAAGAASYDAAWDAAWAAAEAAEVAYAAQLEAWEAEGE